MGNAKTRKASALAATADTAPTAVAPIYGEDGAMLAPGYTLPTVAETAAIAADDLAAALTVVDDELTAAYSDDAVAWADDDDPAPTADDDTADPAPAPRVTMADRKASARDAAAATMADPADAAALTAAVAALSALPPADAADILAGSYGAAVAALTADPAALADPATLAALAALAPHRTAAETAVRAAHAARGATGADPVAVVIGQGRAAVALALSALAADATARGSFDNLAPADAATALAALAADATALADMSADDLAAWMTAHGPRVGRKASAPGAPRSTGAAATALPLADRGHDNYRWTGGGHDGAMFDRGADGWTVTLADGSALAGGPFKSQNKAAVALTGGAVNAWDHLRPLATVAA